MKGIQEKIDHQIKAASERFDLPPSRLKFTTDTFKPDSPKLETVVTVDVGLRDAKSKELRTIRSFYSPKTYHLSPVSKLRKEIEQYLKNKRLKTF